MLHDARGLEVTTDSPEVIAALDRFTDLSLSYGKDAEAVILQGIATEPTSTLMNAHAAAYYLSQETTANWMQALPYLEAAKQNSTWANERERLYLSAVESWANGEVENAIACYEAIADKFPRDLLAVQRGQYHYFYVGNSEGLLGIAEKSLLHTLDSRYILGMLAFGLEQCDRLKEAEEMGYIATTGNRYDPWAQHAVAHVMETQQRVDEGIAWMESFADTWENCNSLLYTHNWWHVALYYLAQKDISKVLSLYDDRIWGRADKNSAKDQVGAISLLLRLELQGIDTGDRWQQLVSYLIARIHEHALPFQDLHYVYALTRAGCDELAVEMLRSMQAHVRQVNPCGRKQWDEIAMPAAEALIAYARGEWTTTIDKFRPILPYFHLIGGSHTQRELFEQVYRDALAHQDRQNRLYVMRPCHGRSLYRAG